MRSGPADARKIHEIAIGSLTMMLGTAVPLLNALLSDGLATESPPTLSHPSLRQNIPSTRTPLAPSCNASSLGTVGCAQPQHSASTSAQSKCKASDVSRQPVLEWRDLATLDSIEGHGAASKSVRKKWSTDRRNRAHAPFTMRFANSVFQGRGAHSQASFGQFAKASERSVEKRKRDSDLIQPMRLFSDNGEPDLAVPSITESDGHHVDGAKRMDADKDPVCSAQSSPSKCCCCCRRGPFLGRCSVQSRCLSRSDLMELEPSNLESVVMDGVLVENYDWEYHPWMRPPGLSLVSSVPTVETERSGLELVVWTPPPVWAPGAAPASKLTDPPVLAGLTVGKCGAPPCNEDGDEGADAEDHLQQPASRDSGGTDPLYGDPCMRQMDALERELRISFQMCEDERLKAARVVGWMRRDIDWVKGAGSWKKSGGGQARATEEATVHVPARGPSKKFASSSGELSNAGIRYRRLLIAEARLLYLSAAIRQHHEGSLGKDSPDELRLAAVRAILSYLSLEFLRCLSKDPRVQQCSIMSAKKMRKKVLRELKEEAAAARKDPMTVLKATIDHSSRAGSIKAYRGMHAILSQSGFGHCLPSDAQMSAAKKGIERLAEADLEIAETRDGYRISLKRAVEMEASRIMQTIAISETSKLTARTVGVQPGGHRWQDFFDIKITFDARRVTRHGSQTEVMMIFMLKGEEGVDRCQKALHHRTIAIWAGKDSRENVQHNLVEMIKEAKELEENGIVFSIAADSFLTVQESEEYQSWMKLPEETRKEKCARMDTESFHNVGIRFWVPADMLAQCSLLGQGCAGNKYCAHCCTHKDVRHLPFELRLVTERVNFRKFADQLDLHAETLWSINTCSDRGPNWKFTEEGLRFMTAPSNLVIQPQPVLETSGRMPGVQSQSAPTKQKRAAGAGAAQVTAQAGPRMPAPAASTMRAPRSSKAKNPPAAAQAASAADCASASNRGTDGRALGPDVGRLSQLVQWRVHGSECLCGGCAIPANTIVRTMLTPGFSRPSAFLGEHWPQMTSARCPFCALHCLMRVTEAMFKQICQFAMAGGEACLKRLNDGLSMAGFKSKKFEKLQTFDSKHYEKLSFLGHESLHLLKRKDGSGDRNIAIILKHIWPQGDAPDRLDKVDGTNFVVRSLDLWEQWATVVELMTERDYQKVLRKNGFATFGKECREFCFLFQAMFHKAQCKAFYLHTLMAHAGDFMRELGKYGMCLGMMSNSGAERRHEYGRRAFKRSLCGGCWAKTNPDLAVKRNLSAFLTLREVLMWQYGADLWSHEMALRADAAFSGESTGDHSTTISSRRQLVAQALASLSRSEPLLSFEEAEKELRGDCNLGAPVPCLETGSEGWITVEHDKSKALESIPFLGEWKEGEPPPPGVQKQEDGSLALLVGRVPDLTNGIADWLSDCSGDGSDNSSESVDGSCRFEDLLDFESDSDDEDYNPDQDRRTSRIIQLLETDAVEVGSLDWHDALLVEKSSDGAWRARSAVDQREHATRSHGEAMSRASIWSEERKNHPKKRRRPLHWGERDGDTRP